VTIWSRPWKAFDSLTTRQKAAFLRAVVLFVADR
jgi:hypothetical protein